MDDPFFRSASIGQLGIDLTTCRCCGPFAPSIVFSLNRLGYHDGRGHRVTGLPAPDKVMLVNAGVIPGQHGGVKPG